MCISYGRSAWVRTTIHIQRYMQRYIRKHKQSLPLLPTGTLEQDEKKSVHSSVYNTYIYNNNNIIMCTQAKREILHALKRNNDLQADRVTMLYFTIIYCYYDVLFYGKLVYYSTSRPRSGCPIMPTTSYIMQVPAVRRVATLQFFAHNARYTSSNRCTDNNITFTTDAGGQEARAYSKKSN